MPKPVMHQQYKATSFSGRASENVTTDAAQVTCRKCQKEAEMVEGLNKIYAEFLAFEAARGK